MISAVQDNERSLTREEQNRCAAQSKLSGDTGTGDVKPVRTNPLRSLAGEKMPFASEEKLLHWALGTSSGSVRVLMQKRGP